MTEADPNEMRSRLVFWDSPDEPPSDGSVYRWNGFVEMGAIRSLPAYVETHGERLRRKYLGWVHGLGESVFNGRRIIDHLAFKDGLSYWWMTLLVEKSPYKSPITDAIRLLALEEIVGQQQPRNVRLVTANRRLHQTVRDLCWRLKIDYDWRQPAIRRPSSTTLRGKYRSSPQPVQALISLARYAWNRWTLIRCKKPSWFDGERVAFFCSYFDNIDLRAARGGRFRSHYWGELHGLLNRMGYRSNWLQLFIPTESVPTPKAGMDWIQRFNQNPHNEGSHAFVDTYLSWGVILRVLKRWLWLMAMAWRLREIERAFRLPDSQLTLWPFMRDDWKASLYGSAAISNLLAIELFDKALGDVPHQKKGLYLYENQGWERALNHSWRKHGHGCLIGVAHSTVRFWDLRYFEDPRTTRATGLYRMPRPDLVALNGKAAVDACLSVGYAEEAIFKCEALRYGYLTRLDVHGRRDRERNGGAKVLVLGDVMVVATSRLLKLLERSARNGPDGDIYVVKPHPNCPVDLEDYPSLSLKIVADPLAVILRDYDVAYGSNGTSAVVDAYLAGVPVVVMLDERELNFSPLRGRPGVRFVSTPEELTKALHAASEERLSRRDSSDFFFLDPELPRWSRLLVR